MGTTASTRPENPNPETSAGVSGENLKVAKTTRTHLMGLSRAQNKFAFQLYQEFAKDGKRCGNNFVCSPLSLSVGLGLVYLGARGNSREEMRKLLYLREVPEEQLLAAYAAMHWDVIRSSFPKGCILESAIRLFGPTSHNMTEEYEDICMHYELARLKSVDFESRPDIARKDMNSWIEVATHGKIKDAIPQGLVSRETSLFLVCAIYMKIFWLHPFDPKKSGKVSFYLPMKETIQVQMMTQKNIFRYKTFSKLDCDILELPFWKKHLRMYVFLPHKNDGLSKIENKLSRAVMETILGQLTEEYVEVCLPKFKYELGVPSIEMFQKLGLKEMFTSGKADLSGIDGTTELSVSRVFSCIGLEFDEGLSDTSAGTTFLDELLLPGPCDLRQKKTFRADHPFLFVIQDNRSGAIYVIGRAIRPVLAT